MSIAPRQESEALRQRRLGDGTLITADQHATAPALLSRRVGSGMLTVGYAKRHDKRIGEDYLCAYFDEGKLVCAVADGITGGRASHVAAKATATHAIYATLYGEDLVDRLNGQAIVEVRAQLPRESVWDRVKRKAANPFSRGVYTSRTMLGCGELDLRTRRLRLRSFGDILTTYKKRDWHAPDAGPTCDQWCSQRGVDRSAVTEINEIVDGVAIFSDGLLVWAGPEYHPNDDVTYDLLLRKSATQGIADDCSIVRYEFY